jgi:MgsA AAA+ ATPase C terminal
VTSSQGPPPTRRGLDAYECVSQVQKALRRGQEERALFFALELDNSGYSAWIWKRLKIVASEDVGIADTQAVLLVHALFAAWKEERVKDKQARGGLFLTHSVIALARAQKSRIADSALIALGEEAPPMEIDDVALDVHTRAGQRRGRGWPFFFESSGLLADPETGELSEDGSTPDPYRERARQVLERPHRTSQPTLESVAEEVEQMHFEMDHRKEQL